MVTKLNQKMDVMNRILLTWEALHQQTYQQEKILQQVLLILQRTSIAHGSADIIAPVQQQEPIQLTVPQTPTFRPTNVITFDSPSAISQPLYAYTRAKQTTTRPTGKEVPLN